MDLEILFEDNYVIAVNKPNNRLIHHSYYARNIKDATILTLLEQQKKRIYYPIHRLDRKTSGVLLLAKEKKYVSDFQNLFNTKYLQKKYIGLVRGFVANSQTIDSPVKNADTGIYKTAETFCEPLLTKELKIPVHPYKTARYSLVALKPRTGRMHQLRIHMNKISHPLVGDYKYGDRFHNRMFEKEFACHHLFLHAYSMHFTHPYSKEKHLVSADFSCDWYQIFAAFGWSSSSLTAL